MCAFQENDGCLRKLKKVWAHESYQSRDLAEFRKARQGRFGPISGPMGGNFRARIELGFLWFSKHPVKSDVSRVGEVVQSVARLSS
jgi:hypothetical protein